MCPATVANHGASHGQSQPPMPLMSQRSQRLNARLKCGARQRLAEVRHKSRPPDGIYGNCGIARQVYAQEGQCTALRRKTLRSQRDPLDGPPEA